MFIADKYSMMPEDVMDMPENTLVYLSAYYELLHDESVQHRADSNTSTRMVVEPRMISTDD